MVGIGLTGCPRGVYVHTIFTRCPVLFTCNCVKAYVCLCEERKEKLTLMIPSH